MRNYKDALDKAQESVESAQSKLESTQDSYDNYTITAPISGQVITKNFKVGDNITKNYQFYHYTWQLFMTCLH